LNNDKEPFDALLEWLDPDREKTGQRYEVIRAGLIRMFVSNGLSDAEHYADVVIDRVMKKLPEIRATYVGEPAKYFHGVARNIIREARRQKEIATDVMPAPPPPVDRSETSDCLSKCLSVLPPDKQAFILDYHLFKGHEKVEHHRQMAGELSITEGALRTRAHHLRVTLEKCVLECIGAPAKNKSAVQRHR
jgi:DNA-directed RNA polymerase specialized sigma24 family protein